MKGGLAKTMVGVWGMIGEGIEGRVHLVGHPYFNGEGGTALS